MNVIVCGDIDITDINYENTPPLEVCRLLVRINNRIINKYPELKLYYHNIRIGRRRNNVPILFYNNRMLTNECVLLEPEGNGNLESDLRNNIIAYITSCDANAKLIIDEIDEIENPPNLIKDQDVH